MLNFWNSKWGGKMVDVSVTYKNISYVIWYKSKILEEKNKNYTYVPRRASMSSSSACDTRSFSTETPASSSEFMSPPLPSSKPCCLGTSDACSYISKSIICKTNIIFTNYRFHQIIIEL